MFATEAKAIAENNKTMYVLNHFSTVFVPVIQAAAAKGHTECIVPYTLKRESDLEELEQILRTRGFVCSKQTEGIFIKW